MLWAALRRGPRDTATVALVLAGITVWGTLTGGGPFTTADLNVSSPAGVDVSDQHYGSELVTERRRRGPQEGEKTSAPRADRTRTEGRGAYARARASPMQQNRASLPWQATICGSHYMRWACSLPSCARRSDRGNGQGRSSWSMQRARKWMKCSIRCWICPSWMLGSHTLQLPNSRSRACCKK